jgi:hypothetical protein
MQRLLLFIIPLTISYAIVSSIGTTGNYYGPPSPAGVSYSGVPETNSNQVK